MFSTLATAASPPSPARRTSRPASTPDPPTAIYVMLIGVMRAIVDAGLSCPTNISIVATDDVTWANAFRPRLTTVRQPVNEMGTGAVRLLIERVTRPSDEPPKRLVLPPTLIVRDSCMPLSGG